MKADDDVQILTNGVKQKLRNFWMERNLINN